MTAASPKKLRNGSWGALVEDTRVKIGDTVTITTRGGKSWDARVERVIWTGSGVAICATASLDRPASKSRGNDSAGLSISSGASYRAGVTAPHGRTCPECGSRECSKAWNARDLCDED